MPSTYLPTRESDLKNWMDNFAGRIAAAPADYGVSPADAAAIAAAVGAFGAALNVALAPGTRTQPAVTAKNGAKKTALAVVRKYAAIIRADPGVDRMLKMNLGLHVPAQSVEGGPVAGSPIPAPATYPILTLAEIRRGAHALRISDSEHERAKPRTAMGMVLFRAVADGPVMKPEAARFLALVTRSECRSDFDHADNGKTATYFARWANLKGELGPWSRPASMPIAA